MDRRFSCDDIARTREFLFHKEIVNKQFVTIEQLEKCGNPGFVNGFTTSFISHSGELISTMKHMVCHAGATSVYEFTQQLRRLKSSTSSIGAQRMTRAVDTIRSCLRGRDIQGIVVFLDKLLMEHAVFSSMLELYIKMRAQAQPPAPAAKASRIRRRIQAKPAPAPAPAAKVSRKRKFRD